MRAIDRYNLLLALLLALLLWIQQQAEQLPDPLFDIGIEQIREIRVLHDGKLAIAMSRDSEGWMLSQPEVSRASTQRVASLSSLLHAQSHWRASAVGANLHTYGLQAPTLSLEFDQHVIHFGNPSTPSGQRYVLAGDQIHLIDESYFRIAGLPAKFFRESR